MRNNKYIACLLSLGILIAIISIGVAARKSISIYKQDSIPVISQKLIYNDVNDTDYNTDNTDGVITSMQLSESSYKQLYTDTYNLGSYLAHLQDYIGASDIHLDVDNEMKKEHLLHELMIIANLEKKNNIQHMSIDGREMATSLIKNIYQVYGIDITFGMDGEIQSVEDNAGNLLYRNTDRTIELEFQVIHLAIVVCIVLLLFGISILLTRKNKIFIKEGDFNGLDEKKYA